MVEVHGDTVLARNDEVHTVELDGEAVLLDRATERLHHLNVSATLVWQCLDGQASLGQIAAEIASAFGADPGQVLTDAAGLLQELVDEGTAIPVTAPPGS